MHLSSTLLVALAAAALLGAARVAPAQARPQPASPVAPVAPVVVRPGAPPVVRDLAGTDTHAYVLDLADRQLVWGAADQHTVDVVVRVTDPTGRVLGTYDAPARGPESFRFVSRAAGPHRIDVMPFGRAAGRYALGIERVEPVATTPVGKVDQLMRPYARRDAPGAVVAVVRGGRPLFSRAYGMANLEQDVPNATGTVFHVASVSKQFTAFAVARLAEEGRLALDDDVRRYVPDVPDFGTPITLRHLLHHTSGLRDQWALWAMAGGRLDDVITQENLLDLVRRQRTLDFVPGAEHRYSNTNYMLLAEVVARVAGEPFGVWMQRTVFEPLGMTRTQVYDDHERVVRHRADSYQSGRTGGTYRRSVLSFANQGATSLLTTADDLALWLANFGTARVGGPGVMRRMQERGVLTGGDTLGYALGIVIDEHRGLKRLQHGGSDAGYRAMLAYYPELDAGVVVLSNYASFDGGAAAREVAEAFFGDRMRPEPAPLAAVAAVTAVAAAPTAPATPATPVVQAGRRAATPRPQGAAELAQYTGRFYSPELETVYTVGVEGDSLVVRHRRNGRFLLTPLDARDEFRAGAWYFERVRFERGAGDRVTGLRVSNGRVRDLRFERED